MVYMLHTMSMQYNNTIKMNVEKKEKHEISDKYKISQLKKIPY